MQNLEIRHVGFTSAVEACFHSTRRRVAAVWSHTKMLVTWSAELRNERTATGTSVYIALDVTDALCCHVTTQLLNLKRLSTRPSPSHSFHTCARNSHPHYKSPPKNPKLTKTPSRRKSAADFYKTGQYPQRGRGFCLILNKSIGFCLEDFGGASGRVWAYEWGAYCLTPTSASTVRVAAGKYISPLSSASCVSHGVDILYFHVQPDEMWCVVMWCGEVALLMFAYNTGRPLCITSMKYILAPCDMLQWRQRRCHWQQDWTGHGKFFCGLLNRGFECNCAIQIDIYLRNLPT